jgi:hypothetical protein
VGLLAAREDTLAAMARVFPAKVIEEVAWSTAVTPSCRDLGPRRSAA